MVERDSYPIGTLLVLGVICVIIGGFSPGQDIVQEWVSNLQHFLVVLGVILIGLAIVLRQNKKTAQ